MSAGKNALLEKIESLSEEQARKVSALLHTLKSGTNVEKLFKDLASNREFFLPRNLPPYFKKVDPAIGKGIPAS